MHSISFTICLIVYCEIMVITFFIDKKKKKNSTYAIMTINSLPYSSLSLFCGNIKYKHTSLILLTLAGYSLVILLLNLKKTVDTLSYFNLISPITLSI